MLALDSRPGLILAPANTWDVTIGRAMLEQARMRADEVGATLLWCDAGGGGGSSPRGKEGGEDVPGSPSSGVSGVVGQYESTVQIGRGTFVKTVGVKWPFGDPERRTMYAAGGDLMVLVIVWGLVLGLWSIESLLRGGPEGGVAAAVRAVSEMGMRYTNALRERYNASIASLRKRVTRQYEARDHLIDTDDEEGHTNA